MPVDTPGTIFVFDATVEPQVLIYKESFVGDDNLAAWNRMEELSQQFGPGCQVDYVNIQFLIDNLPIDQALDMWDLWNNTTLNGSVDASWARSAIGPEAGPCGIVKSPVQDGTPVTVAPPVTVAESPTTTVSAVGPLNSEVSPTFTSTVETMPADDSSVVVMAAHTDSLPMTGGYGIIPLLLLAVVLLSLGVAAVRRTAGRIV